MAEKFVTINGIDYLRRVEMIGDVEKITYFSVEIIDDDTNMDTYREIYNQELSNELEFVYLRTNVYG